MKLMIAHLAESLENFQEEEHWKDEHFVWLNDFLSEPGQRTIFFWNDFEDLTLRVNNTAPPKFYGKYQSSGCPLCHQTGDREEDSCKYAQIAAVLGL